MLNSIAGKRTFSTASSQLAAICQTQIDTMRETGTYKVERVITTSQDTEIMANGKHVINFCANNYLGLSNHPRIVKAA